MHVRTLAESPKNERGGGQVSYLLLRKGQFGSSNLAITWVDCAPGSEQPLHEHATQEQVYVILRGRGTMIAGGEECEVSEGSLVFVPPRTPHAIRNTSDGPMSYVSATAPPFDDAALDSVFAYHPPA